jgi:hypothetical protein
MPCLSHRLSQRDELVLMKASAASQSLDLECESNLGEQGAVCEIGGKLARSLRADQKIKL